MSFTSPTFLFVFLPAVLLLTWALPGVRSRNAALLASSLLFYAWAEPHWLPLLLALAALTWAGGLAVAASRRRQGLVFAAAVAVDLAPLLAVKYLPVLAPGLGPARLPLGVSYFTFMAISYLVGVRRGDVEAQRDPRMVALYVTLFPLVVAGPIARYRDLAGQLAARAITLPACADGAARFVVGLAKKLLLADTLYVPAAAILTLPRADLGAGVAWLGVACAALALYLDFSGYSDMAIGVGRMLGLRIPENFAYPYTAASVREFWTRWHITLSTWFRDYVFLPVAYPASRALERLGLGRRAVELGAYAAASGLTMALIGVWHGATASFLIWGLYHAALLVLERTPAGRRLDRWPRPARQVATLLAVSVGWVLFGCPTLAQAGAVLGALVGLGGGAASLARFANVEVVLALAVGALASTRLAPWVRARLAAGVGEGHPAVRLAQAAALAVLLLLSLTWLAGGSFRPFLYAGF